MSTNEKEPFYPQSRKAWRLWLQKHHDKEESVWVIFYKKGSGKPSMSWSDAVDEALCFGWIDSKRKPIDEEKFIQSFSRRKPRGTWSKINKEKVEQLIADGQMTKAGLDVIAAAKQNGSWAILDEVEALEMPADLEAALKTSAGLKDYYLGLSKSVKKRVLYWLVSAKRQETREKRISEIIAHAAQGKIPKQIGG